MNSNHHVKKEFGTLLLEHERVCGLSHPAKCDDAARDRIRGVAGRIHSPGWRFKIQDLPTGELVLRAAVQVKDIATGSDFENFGPPYVMCPAMDETFLVDFLFDVIMELQWHEIAEMFYFDGRRVFYPHDPSGAPLYRVPTWAHQVETNQYLRDWVLDPVQQVQV
jgi:hypothetical protein